MANKPEPEWAAVSQRLMQLASYMDALLIDLGPHDEHLAQWLVNAEVSCRSAGRRAAELGSQKKLEPATA